MHVATTTSVALMLFALSACVPPPTIRDSQSAAIGISMGVTAPVPLFRFSPDKVYFVTAERKEDLYTQGRMVESNSVKFNRAYLLTALPGYYAAVAAHHTIESMRITYHYKAFFTQEVVEHTGVSVGPGTIAYIGDYVVNQAGDVTNPDEAQISFMPLVDRTALVRMGGTKEAIMAGATVGVAGGGFSSSGSLFFYSGVLGESNRDRRAEETFLEKAMDDLRDGGWSGILQQRIDALRLDQ